MFEIEKTADGGITLAALDGTVIPVPPEVLAKLQDADILMSEWKKYLQAFSLQNMAHAKALKAECPTDAEYRELRAKLRLL